MSPRAHHALRWPFGWLDVVLDGDMIVALDMRAQPHPDSLMDSSHPSVILVRRWLDGDFSVADSAPIRLEGSAFQRRVWSGMRTIPAGEIRSYGDLARALGSSPRAVAGACRRNPVALLLPCHRVVSATGIGGYAGATQGEPVARKRWLLAREGVHFPS